MRLFTGPWFSVLGSNPAWFEWQERLLGSGGDQSPRSGPQDHHPSTSWSALLVIIFDDYLFTYNAKLQKL